MSDFKVIETQEQLDAVIGERIAKARQKALEEFSDYDQIKSQLSALSSQMAEKDNLINENKDTIASLQSKVQEYESHSVKRRIALEVGISESLADRLVGDDEEAMRKDAESLKAIFGQSQVVPPLGSTEPQNDTDEPYRKMVLGLKGE